MKSSKEVLALTDPAGTHVIFCLVMRTQEPLGYLKAFDPERHQGRGEARFTGDKNKALRFSSENAFECWRLASKRRPFRPDGKPNRPLTAFSATFPTFEAGASLDPLALDVLRVVTEAKLARSS